VSDQGESEAVLPVEIEEAGPENGSGALPEAVIALQNAALPDVAPAILY
jgi:hypothetical protein